MILTLKKFFFCILKLNVTIETVEQNDEIKIRQIERQAEREEIKRSRTKKEERRESRKANLDANKRFDKRQKGRKKEIINEGKRFLC